MKKEKLAEIYLQEFGVEEMINFVCSLTDDEIENIMLWICSQKIESGWMLKGVRPHNILLRTIRAKKDIW